MRASTVWMEMVILAMCLILGSNAMLQFITEVSSPMLSYTTEKSAVDTDDVVSWYDTNNANSNVRYGKDLLLALLNTDEYACYPNAIKIDNSPIFKLNMEFQTQKETRLKEIYDATGPYALGDPSRLNGKINACIYETGVDGPYLHYYILTSP